MNPKTHPNQFLGPATRAKIKPVNLDPSPTLHNDIARFLDECDYSPATIATYAYHLDHLADWITQHQLVPEAITGQQLRGYLNAHDWKPNTQRAAGNAAKSFLRWRYGASHPALRLKLPKDTSAPGRVLDVDQVYKLLSIFDTTQALGWRNLTMLALMVESGIRAAEACQLEVDHIHLDRRAFSVLSKGRKWREGIFSSVTGQYLAVWLAARKEIAVKGCPYLFVSVNGKTTGQRMTPAGLRANFRRYGLAAGIGKLSPHDLRRTMATLLIERGAPTRMVQELGGWEDIRMVEHYTRKLKPQNIEQFTPLLKFDLL